MLHSKESKKVHSQLLNVGNPINLCSFPGVPLATTSLTVPPGSMSRYAALTFISTFPDNIPNSIVIPVKKLLLPEEQLSKPIPTLSDRQFVVQKSQVSGTELKTQLELFWYREELLKCIRGRWQEVSIYSSILNHFN